MLSKNIFVVVLVAYLANATTGSPLRRRSSKLGLSSNSHSIWPTSGLTETREEERPNEYDLIFKARMERKNSPNHQRPSSIHSRKSLNPFAKNNKPSPFSLPSEDEDDVGFQRNPSFSSGGRSGSWQKNGIRGATVRKVGPSDDEPEYVY